MSADRYVGAVDVSDWCARHAILTPLVSVLAASGVDTFSDPHCRHKPSICLAIAIEIIL